MKKMTRSDFYLLCALVMMLVLFISSSMTYQQQTSVPLLERILRHRPALAYLKHFTLTYAGNVISVEKVGYYKFIEFFIRKLAHFTTYFLLGSFLYLAVKNKLSAWVAIMLAVLAALGYAASDEFHQMLTGGRTPLFQDVMLDGMGALTGVLLCYLVSFFHSFIQKKQN
ncbi:VanZ like family protein [Ligilactobacillus sp. WC1T17]|uniref:VanZ like family protein n=1 Tax=Ligilactobacillus ruminis TaxID=1623 RepID=A0ABY1AE54_9LACO|nr:VanZ like family protein [Ligilactobacillus ruminis]